VSACNRKVLITGGARGLGRNMVDGFLKDGADVAVLEKSSEICFQLQKELVGRARVWECDVTDHKKISRVMREMRDAGFEPDVLINNAGSLHSEPLVNVVRKTDRVHSHETWRNVLASNLDSVFFVTGSVVDSMVRRRCPGVVISISSVAARGNAGQSAYSAAKAGVIALTRTWAKELGSLGIRFVAISPGFINTESTRSALGDVRSERLRQQIPLRRLGDPVHVYQAARAIVDNDYINGTVVEVDGGITI